MQKYKNLGGSSGVYAYEIGSDYIHIKFTGTNRVYSYSYSGKAGRIHVENMKQLAQNGSGLNAYVNQKVKFLYD